MHPCWRYKIISRLWKDDKSSLPSAINKGIIRSEVNHVCCSCLLWISRLYFHTFSYSEVCLVEKDNRWFRAICCNLHEKSALMLLLDHDQLESIPLKRIRELPEHLAFTCLTVRCFLPGELEKKLSHRSSLFKRWHRFLLQQARGKGTHVAEGMPATKQNNRI